jgi:hypothetical protein
MVTVMGTATMTTMVRTMVTMARTTAMMAVTATAVVAVFLPAADMVMSVVAVLLCWLHDAYIPEESYRYVWKYI